MDMPLDCDALGPDGVRPLHRAMKPWNGVEVRRLVAAGADVNGLTDTGNSVLGVAANMYMWSTREKAAWQDTLGPVWEQKPGYVEVTLESLHSHTMEESPTMIDRWTNKMLNNLGFIQLSDEVLKEL